MGPGGGDGAGGAMLQGAYPAGGPAAVANFPKQQEVSLAITLVSISLLFIVCQSVKIITDVYELACEKILSSGRHVVQLKFA